jgi:hypothetical protein
MKVSVAVLLVGLAIVAAFHVDNSPPKKKYVHDPTKPSMSNLLNLQKIHAAGFIDEDEFERRREKIIDEMTGVKDSASVVGNVGAMNVTYRPEIIFMLNQMQMGLPRSYDDILPTGQQYWKTPMYLNVGALAPNGKKVAMDSQIATQERTLSRFGLNLYDGATWEIALCLEDLCEVAKVYETNVLYTCGTGANPVLGGLIDIRADKPGYAYGPKKTTGDALEIMKLPGNVTRIPQDENGNPDTKASKEVPGAYFYRMIGPKYAMRDPLDGDYANSWKVPYPNNDTSTPWNIFGEIHFNDWKPITGENVWAGFIGPLQTLWITNGTNMTEFTTWEDTPPEVQLGLTLMPATMALQSPLGSMYHCPKGTQMFPADPSEETNVSNENNFSAYAAYRMLRQILNKYAKGASDPVLVKAMTDLDSLCKGLDTWFSKYLMSDANDPADGYKVNYQGGHVSFDGTFYPAHINTTGGLAVDCQTWGMTVLGQKKMDQYYGANTAFELWQTTKKLAGYYDPNGKLGGVGYTFDLNHTIWSAEWSWGAINMAEQLAWEYEQDGNSANAASLKADADEMYSILTQPIKRCKNGAWCGGGLLQEDGGYLYANDRFFIPWGWYANPIGATCSTGWGVMYEHKYNPFCLGGNKTSPLPDPTEEEMQQHLDRYHEVFGTPYQAQYTF